MNINFFKSSRAGFGRTSKTLHRDIAIRKNRLGRTQLEVSRWGLGGIALSTVMGGSSEETIAQVIAGALDLGVNCSDTARIYMDSEANIGRALRGKRERVILASKSLSRHADDVLDDIACSLQDLQTDRIDIYQIHDLRPHETAAVLSPGGALEGLKKARQQGLIDFIGLTCHHTGVCVELIKTGEFDTVMFPFNAIERDPEKELLALAKKMDIGTLVMKPIAGGAITNTEMAFRFFNAYPVDVILNGVANLSELHGNTKCALDERPLSAQELADFEAGLESLGKQFCRHCNYCMPCPNDIIIPPMIHVIYQSIAGRRLEDLGPEKHNLGRTLLMWYAFCEECGRCEERCPYDLPTIQRKRELVRFFSPLQTEETS